MRITNQMISNNSLRNMQKTMANVDNRTTQMETGKKITKASEDPVVAVRALKLRTMVTQLEQYKDKNIGDAESWLKITTTSLDNITSRLEDIQSYCTQGSTDSFKTSDRSAIIDVLKEMQDMINSEEIQPTLDVIFSLAIRRIVLWHLTRQRISRNILIRSHSI